MNAVRSRSETPHRAFAALHSPGYPVYLIGSAVAMMADAVEHVISYWMIFQKFQSPALGGFAVVSHWLPFLLFSMYTGALADRFDPRRIIQFAMLLYMVCSFAWGMLFLFGILEVWHAVVLLTIHGMAGVLWAPSSQLLVHDIAGREHLQSAVRLMAMSRMLGLLGGPAVGGALLLLFGPSEGLLLNVLIYLPLTFWLWRAPFGPAFRKEARAPVREIASLSGILATLREIAGNRTVVAMTLVAGASSFAVGNAYQAQMPEFATDLGHGQAGFYYSMLLGANALGALVAGVILESRGLLQASPRSAFILMLLWCLCIGGFAASTIYPLSLLLLFAAGFLNLAFGAMSQALVQLHAPHHIRGRVLGLYNTAQNGMRTFSGVTIGVGGSLIGVHWSLGLSAAALLLITLVIFAYDVRAEEAAPAE